MANLKLAATSRAPHDPVLDMAGRWRLARTKALLAWAEHDAATEFGTNESRAKLADNGDAMQEMNNAAFWLSTMEPVTILGVREALNVALDILAHREIYPHRDTLDGPALQIVRNARAALDWMDDRMPVRS